jgi:hypothetical protein
MTTAPSASAPAPAGWVVRRTAEPSGVRIWGLAPEERLLRALRRAGCGDLRVVEEAAPPPAHGAVLALRADIVLDERLVEGLRGAPDTLLVTRSQSGRLHVSGVRPAAPRTRAPARRPACRVAPSELRPPTCVAAQRESPTFSARADTGRGRAAHVRRVGPGSHRSRPSGCGRAPRKVVRWCAPRAHLNAVTVSGVLALAGVRCCSRAARSAWGSYAPGR